MIGSWKSSEGIELPIENYTCSSSLIKCQYNVNFTMLEFKGFLIFLSNYFSDTVFV